MATLSSTFQGLSLNKENAGSSVHNVAAKFGVVRVAGGDGPLRGPVFVDLTIYCMVGVNWVGGQAFDWMVIHGRSTNLGLLLALPMPHC
jgi:hypothetical protein